MHFHPECINDRGSATDPAGAAKALPRPLANFRGPLRSRGKGKKGKEGGGKGEKGYWGRERGREGKRGGRERGRRRESEGRGSLRHWR